MAEIPYRKNTVYFQYYVNDFNRAKKFYEDILGLEKCWDGGEEIGWAEFELPLKGAKLGLNLRKDQDVRKGSGVLTLEAEDIEMAKENLDEKGIETSEIVDMPDMVTYFNIHDTEGNPIQFVADPRVKSG
jgi:predicted enzyme related to lactoylglutathione lyase